MADAIVVDRLSKRYQIGNLQLDTTLREKIVGIVRDPFGRSRGESANIWALQDVSFSVKAGEVVGIVGRNGAGKSTLLKILSRITYPTAGSVTVQGRVASLLEVGTGFHEELTGRENVYLNGSILGMTKKEVTSRFDEIVEFAGVEQFIDTPIKRYSSGMRLRLGFAVAAHLDPDVLIVDEVLAVGDVGFQKKCLAIMDDLRSGGRTVLFVSHNMAAVENLCSRGIWIDAGKTRMDGDSKDVIAAYLDSFVGERNSGADLSVIKSRLGGGEIRYTRLEYLNPDGTERLVVRSGDGLIFRFHFHARTAVREPSFGFRLFSTMGTLITDVAHWLQGIHIPRVEPGAGYIDVEIDSLNLVPGQYSMSLWITAFGGEPVYDGDVRVSLDVEAADVFGSGRLLNSGNGLMFIPQRWKMGEARE